MAATTASDAVRRRMSDEPATYATSPTTARARKAHDQTWSPRGWPPWSGSSIEPSGHARRAAARVSSAVATPRATAVRALVRRRLVMPGVRRARRRRIVGGRRRGLLLDGRRRLLVLLRRGRRR